MEDVEKIGLVKFDFLGIKTLTLMDKAVKAIKKNRNIDIDIENLPLADKDTYKLIASGNTNGVFQLESSGLKELLKKTQARELRGYYRGRRSLQARPSPERHDG